MPRNKSKTLQKRVQSYASGIKTTALITTLNYVLRIVQNLIFYYLLNILILTNTFRFAEVFSLNFLSSGFNLSDAPWELKLSYELYEKSILLRSYKLFRKFLLHNVNDAKFLSY